MLGAGTLIPVLGVSGAAAVASLVGVALVHLRPAWTRAAALPLAALAGGAILGAAFLDLLPEAIERAGASACDWALASFFVLYVLETHVVRHEHHQGHSHGHEEEREAAARHAMIPGEAHAAHVHEPRAGGAAIPLAWIAGLAFALHSTFDGLALGVGYSSAVALGPAATLGVLAHKIPEGMALAALLLAGRLSTGRALAIATAIALLTPASAITAWALLDASTVSALAFGRLLGLVAGSFVYIATADLLPEVAAHPRPSRTLLMIVGIGLALAMRYL